MVDQTHSSDTLAGTELDSRSGRGHAQPAPERLRQIGPYRVTRLLGRGGMGVVYAARREGDPGEVALKVLNSQDAEPEALARFRREAEVMARLRHPALVRVQDMGVEQGRHYVVMPLVEGESLQEALRRGPFPQWRAAEIALQVAQALDHAHRAGVLHRDLKPANVMLTPEGDARLLDFGIAKLAHADDRLTATGQLLGTPSYMAPEQAGASAHTVSELSDLYALGATLYAMLAGHAPFEGATAMAILVDVASKAPPPLSGGSSSSSSAADPIDPRLEAICMRCLHKDPRKRYASAAALAAALYDLLEARGPRAGGWTVKHWAGVVAGAGVIGALALGVALHLAPPTKRDPEPVKDQAAAVEGAVPRPSPPPAPEPSPPTVPKSSQSPSPKPPLSPSERKVLRRLAARQRANHGDYLEGLLRRSEFDNVGGTEPDEAVKKASALGVVYYVRARVDLQSADPTKALDDFRRVDDPNRVGQVFKTPTLHTLRGRTFFECGYYEESLPDLELASEQVGLLVAPAARKLQDPCLELRLRALFALARYEEACALADRVATAHQPDWRLTAALARNQIRAGRLEAAQASWAEAQKLAGPADPLATFRLKILRTELLTALGRFDEAREVLAALEFNWPSAHHQALFVTEQARLVLAEGGGEAGAEAERLAREALGLSREVTSDAFDPDSYGDEVSGTTRFGRDRRLYVAERLRALERVETLAILVAALRAQGRPVDALLKEAEAQALTPIEARRIRGLSR